MTVFLEMGTAFQRRKGRLPLLPRRVPKGCSSILHPTYTGKTMAGYRKLLSEGQYADADAALFLHTGGAPSLFTQAVEGMV